MIGLLRILLFLTGLFIVIVGGIATILAALLAWRGEPFLSELVLGQGLGGGVALLAGTIGVSKLDKMLKAKRDRRRTVAAQTGEFT